MGFTRALRHAGVGCTPRQVATFLTALGEIDLADPAQVYWAGRSTLCSEPEELPHYDAAFRAWFTGAAPPRPARQDGASPLHRTRTASLVASPDGAGELDADVGELRVAASDAEVLRHRDLSELSVAERRRLRELLAELDPQPPLRAALRRRPASRGSLDPRRTLRAMLRNGGEPLRLARRRRARRPRRLVLLVDVSGSMEPYSDALLRFAHLVVRRAPSSTEVFTLGTRLTRVTRQLRERDPERALVAAARAVPDYAGGTRLGEGLRVFLDRWGQRGAARRAVVVLFSDGWERGDTTLLAGQLARLRRLAHRVLWVNPHAGRKGYAPIQSGIVAALPHIDRLLAGHSLATLAELLAEVRRA